MTADTPAIVSADNLVALAARCASFSGDYRDWDLDRDLAAVLGWEPVFGPRELAPPFRRSMDLAPRLVPEGYGWRLWVPSAAQHGDGDRPRVTVWGPSRTCPPQDFEAATAALALCGASLMARAYATASQVQP